MGKVIDFFTGKEKKEKAPHEKTLEDIFKKTELINTYTSVLSLRAEQFIHEPKKAIFERLGEEKAFEYLSTRKGHEEYAKLAADKAQEMVLDELKIDKSKFSDKELESIVKTMYKINKKTLTEFAGKHGPNLHHGLYLKDHLQNHLDMIEQVAILDHLKKYDSAQSPAILDHICAGKHTEYFKPELIDELSKDHFKQHMLQAITLWNKGGQTLGLDYFRNSEKWHMYLKDEHRPKELPKQAMQSYREAA